MKLFNRKGMVSRAETFASGAVSRRSLVRAGGLGLAGLTLPHLSGSQITFAQQPEKKAAGRKLFYPPSEILSRLEWLGPPTRYSGSGTDMHWWAWGDDDALYMVDDDGSNFGLPKNFAHFLRVTGTPPDHKVTEVSRFPTLKRYSMQKLRYVDGALAVGSRLYVAAYDYNFQDFSKEVYRLEENNPYPVSLSKETWFIDAISQHGGVAALMYSDDYGKSWQNVPDAATPYFLGPRFAGLAFVGFGPGYTGVPSRFGDYVYAISNDENWENGNHVFLARVPKSRVLERMAWEFYAGISTEPAWVAEEDQARPILSDPGHVGHPAMTYNAGLKRFLLAFGCDSVSHSFATPREVAAATWHRARELHIYEGPTPWGPWGLVHHDPYWEGEHVAYLPQIPSKWLSQDGLRGTLLFSGDYNHFPKQPRPPDYESYYGFMTRPFRLLRKNKA